MDDDNNNKFALSPKDRFIIANQLKILEKLYPEEANDYALERKAIESGFALHYTWILERFSEELSVKECEVVLEILNMYRAITDSFETFTDADKNNFKKDEIEFRGFDGNNETKLWLYANYFINDLGRFQELLYGSKSRDFNSHGSPRLHNYQQMLQQWKEMGKPHRLNNVQIRSLINAQYGRS